MVGTLEPLTHTDPEVDCENIRDAFRGVGTDEDALITIICNRSAEQRVELLTKYKTLFGKDLMDDIKSETSMNFKNVLLALMQSTPNFLARTCKKAIKGAGTSEGALINILVGATSEELRAIKESYKKITKNDLEKDVEGDTSGTLQRVLISLLQCNRDTGVGSDEQIAGDAQELFKAGKDRIGTDESTFNKILAARSPEHLKKVFKEYKKIAGEDIESSIKSEMSGDAEEAFIAIAKLIKDPQMYFAGQLYKSMKGLGTNDDKLIRLMVWRCEIDLVEIKECFKKIASGKTLEKFIEGDCSGDYKTALLALC